MIEKTLNIVGTSPPDVDGWIKITIEMDGKRASFRSRNDFTPEQQIATQKEIESAYTEIGLLQESTTP